MNTLRRISISTLSPVHIGCGEAFEPSLFVIAENALHVLDPVTLANNLNDTERKQLVTLASGPNSIGALQQFFKARRTQLVQLSSEVVEVTSDIAREYELTAGQVQARGGNGQPVYKMYDIMRTAYNPIDRAPYLPGSSIKGSLRTAWLNHLNAGRPIQGSEARQPEKLQSRLLGYAPGKFENDPFRNLHISDAHCHEDYARPPKRIAYAISKKKRLSERGSPELRVYLETIRESLPSAFMGEIRTHGSTIQWENLCDACNEFYLPQLEEELDHPILGPLLTPSWRKETARLLRSEMHDLMKARQGILLRIGRHSGAESVTLNGIRNIKILGGKDQPDTFRSSTTEKRFVSPTKAARDDLLPFGWVWLECSDDAHQHISVAITDSLSALSRPIKDAHAELMLKVEEYQEAQRRAADAARENAALEAERERKDMEAKQAAEDALAAMTPNQRKVAEFITEFRERLEKYPNSPERANAALHGKARALAKAAEAPEWSPEEKRAAAEAIEEWLPKVVKIDIKDERKKLKLAALKGGS